MPNLTFWGPNHIFGSTEATVIKFWINAGCIKFAVLGWQPTPYWAWMGSRDLEFLESKLYYLENSAR